MVDTINSLMVVVVHAANIYGIKVAPLVFHELKFRFFRLVKIVTYGRYSGELVENAKKALGEMLEIILKKDDSPKFQVIAKRWVVERIFE